MWKEQILGDIYFVCFALLRTEICGNISFMIRNVDAGVGICNECYFTCDYTPLLLFCAVFFLSTKSLINIMWGTAAH